jgi:general secretion pathway protein H
VRIKRKAARKITWTSSVGKILNDRFSKMGNARGFTLLELIVVLVFIGLIASLTTPFLMSTLERVQHRAETRKVNSALRFARSEAITHKTVFTFNGEPRKYWISTGKKDGTAATRTLAPGYTMEHITSDEEIIENEAFAIQFYPRGNSSGGAIRIKKLSSDKSDTAYEISIDAITGTSKINH